MADAVEEHVEAEDACLDAAMALHEAIAAAAAHAGAALVASGDAATGSRSLQQIGTAAGNVIKSARSRPDSTAIVAKLLDTNRSTSACHAK
jgi:hypothetical protein